MAGWVTIFCFPSLFLASKVPLVKQLSQKCFWGQLLVEPWNSVKMIWEQKTEDFTRRYHRCARKLAIVARKCASLTQLGMDILTNGGKTAFKVSLAFIVSYGLLDISCISSLWNRTLLSIQQTRSLSAEKWTGELNSQQDQQKAIFAAEKSKHDPLGVCHVSVWDRSEQGELVTVVPAWFKTLLMSINTVLPHLKPVCRTLSTARPGVQSTPDCQ